MYSKNDYRYYLEHRASQSDDFLMHYGVKGMRWHKHLKRKFEDVSGITARKEYEKAEETVDRSKAFFRDHGGETDGQGRKAMLGGQMKAIVNSKNKKEEYDNTPLGKIEKTKKKAKKRAKKFKRALKEGIQVQHTTTIHTPDGDTISTYDNHGNLVSEKHVRNRRR